MQSTLPVRPPSRPTAEGRLRIRLSTSFPGSEPIGVYLVRSGNWDGAQNVAAFYGVVLLDLGPAVNVQIVIERERWTVDLVVQPHQPEDALSHYLRTVEYLHNRYHLQEPSPGVAMDTDGRTNARRRV